MSNTWKVIEHPDNQICRPFVVKESTRGKQRLYLNGKLICKVKEDIGPLLKSYLNPKAWEILI
jgi:hypothetical protein